MLTRQNSKSLNRSSGELHGKTRMASVLIFVVGFAFCLLDGDSAIADEKSASREQDEKSRSPNSSVEEEKEEQAERRAKGEAALYIVIGVAAVGVVLILVVLLIGWMIRRRVRRPAKCEASTNDQLWHLRNPSESPSKNGEAEL